MSWETSEGEDLFTLQSFAQRWAVGTLRQAGRLREARKRANLLSWQYDRGEDWSPGEEQLHGGYEDAWVEQHLLVVAAHQFSKWARRLAAVETGGVRRETHEHLESLRNSVEHLDEALLEGDYAVPDPRIKRKKWGLSELPGEGLFLGSDWRGPGTTAFGVLDVEALEEDCRTVVSDIFDDRAGPAIDSYVQSLIDDARGR